MLLTGPQIVTAESVGIPELRYVVLVSGDEVVMEETFEEALRSLFETNVDVDGGPDTPPDETPPTPPGRLHGTAIAGMGISAIVGVAAMFALMRPFSSPDRADGEP